MARQSKYTLEILEPVVKSSYTMAEVLRKLGRKQGGGFQRYIALLIDKHKLDISHFKGQSWSKGLTSDTHLSINKRVKLSDIDVLKNNGKWISGVRLKKTLLRLGVLNQCSRCNLSTWLDESMPLQVDHIDGNRGNNEFENLRLLCPNCHALTDTWGNKKRGGLAK